MIEIFDRFVRALAWLGAAALLLLTCLMTLDVVLRYIFARSVHGSLELVEFMLVAVFSLSLAWAQRNKHHVAVELFVEAAPPGVQRFLFYFNNIIVFGVMTVMAYAVLRSGMSPGKKLEFSDHLLIPVWPFYWLLAGGIALMSLQLVADIIKGPQAQPRHEEAAL